VRKYIRIGVDIAKNCFQVHALESEDCSATKRRLSRSGIVKFRAEVEPWAIGMEACGSAHYWPRRFRAMGHEVKLTPPIYVKPYVKRGRNDAAAAAAICEAMSRPNMRFVAVKSEDQQATLMAHRIRELLIKQRTMSVNALRVIWRSSVSSQPKGSATSRNLSREPPQPTFRRWSRRRWGSAYAIAVSRRGDRRAGARDRRRPSTRSGQPAGGERPRRRRARRFGDLASAPDPRAFKSGRDFAAWLGATPKQNSTGGKEKFGSITKQGNRYIRRLLVLGAISVLRVSPRGVPVSPAGRWATSGSRPSAD
jgi:transposase